VAADSKVLLRALQFYALFSPCTSTNRSIQLVNCCIIWDIYYWLGGTGGAQTALGCAKLALDSCMVKTKFNIAVVCVLFDLLS
jgi:hypothetical protein